MGLGSVKETGRLSFKEGTMVQGLVIVEERRKSEEHVDAGAEGRPVLLFDGSCDLCHWAVRFTAKRDWKGVVCFASLQSSAGQALLAKGGLPTQESDSLVLVEGERVYRKSGAVLRLLRLLKAPWPLAYGFILMPRLIRDAVYDIVAGNRYRIWGRHDVCVQPSPELRERLLD